MSDTNTTASAGGTTTEAAPAGRRALLGVAALAGLAGAGVAWWRFQPREVADVSAFWTHSFTTPAGDPLALTTLRGKPLLVNFWATWCPPCVEELPLLNSFYLENKANGWQVLGLAVDQLDPVKRFLARAPLDFPIGMAGLAGVDLTRQLGNAAGGLPFTVAFGADGQLRERKLGQVRPADLAAWRTAS